MVNDRPFAIAACCEDLLVEVGKHILPANAKKSKYMERKSPGSVFSESGALSAFALPRIIVVCLRQ